MRDSAIIYRSFFEAIRELPEQNQSECWKAIFEYVFESKTNELTGLSKMVFTLIKPQLDANNNRYEIGKKYGHLGGKHGKKGGRPKKDGKEKTPKGVIDETLKKPANENVNVNDNENKNDKENENPSFDDFWNLYDKKVDRNETQRKWNRLNQADKEAIMKFIPEYKKSIPDKQFRKHPDSFIFNRTWEDELIQTTKNGHAEPATIKKTWAD